MPFPCLLAVDEWPGQSVVIKDPDRSRPGRVTRRTHQTVHARVVEKDLLVGTGVGRGAVRVDVVLPRGAPIRQKPQKTAGRPTPEGQGGKPGGPPAPPPIRG